MGKEEKFYLAREYKIKGERWAFEFVYKADYIHTLIEIVEKIDTVNRRHNYVILDSHDNVLMRFPAAEICYNEH